MILHLAEHLEGVRPSSICLCSQSCEPMSLVIAHTDRANQSSYQLRAPRTLEPSQLLRRPKSRLATLNNRLVMLTSTHNSPIPLPLQHPPGHRHPLSHMRNLTLTNQPLPQTRRPQIIHRQHPTYASIQPRTPRRHRRDDRERRQVIERCALEAAVHGAGVVAIVLVDGEGEGDERGVGGVLGEGAELDLGEHEGGVEAFAG